MKAFLFFGFLGIMLNSVFGFDYPFVDKGVNEAGYEVPVVTELKEYAQFELPDFKKIVDDNKISIEYSLPEVLAGNGEKIKLEGEISANKAEVFLAGKKGAAKCVMQLSAFTCVVVYENLELDEGEAIEAIRNLSTSDKEFFGRIKVMRSFSTDPVGIITY